MCAFGFYVFNQKILFYRNNTNYNLEQIFQCVHFASICSIKFFFYRNSTNYDLEEKNSMRVFLFNLFDQEFSFFLSK